MKKISPSRKAIKLLGGPAKVAALFRVTTQAACFWRDGSRQFPVEHCPAVEFETRGRVTADQLRDDITWHRIPDEGWPHPQGRPVIDYGIRKAA